jgi:hypothetical protein
VLLPLLLLSIRSVGSLTLNDGDDDDNDTIGVADATSTEGTGTAFGATDNDDDDDIGRVDKEDVDGVVNKTAETAAASLAARSINDHSRSSTSITTRRPTHNT